MSTATPDLQRPAPIDPGLSDRRLIGFHGAFLVTATIFVLLPVTMPVGWRVFAAGVAYNLALPTFAARHVEPRWIRQWLFLLPLSWLLIFPDWYLVTQLGTLAFPDLGIAKIGPVSAFMGLLWIIPLFLVVYLGDRVAERRGPSLGAMAASGASFAAFAFAEASLTHLDLWRAVGVTTVGRVALYVIVPEAILGACAFIAFRATEDRGAPWRLLAAMLVMLVYLGSLIVSWWLIES